MMRIQNLLLTAAALLAANFAFAADLPAQLQALPAGEAATICSYQMLRAVKESPREAHASKDELLTLVTPYLRATNVWSGIMLESGISPTTLNRWRTEILDSKAPADKTLHSYCLAESEKRLSRMPKAQQRTIQAQTRTDVGDLASMLGLPRP